MNTTRDIIKTLMTQGKGILAADESSATADQRFNALSIPATEENRRTYRELLFTTPGIEQYLSGVILFDETIRQTSHANVPFSVLLAEKNILSGIKVDQGLEEGHGGQVTKGMTDLSLRLGEYKNLGATFTKWRAVARVGDGFADPAIKENAQRLASYATVVLESGMVPMIEPEVLMEGTHSAEAAEGALIETLAIVFDALLRAKIDPTQVILKTSMAVSGASAEFRADAKEVAERTVRALKTSVPENIGGVVFLSGGQAPEEATANLNAIARLEPHPWPVTFSFSRALQEPVLATWAGDSEMYDEAQAIFLKRLSLNAVADAGGYAPGMELV